MNILYPRLWLVCYCISFPVYFVCFNNQSLQIKIHCITFSHSTAARSYKVECNFPISPSHFKIVNIVV